MDEVRIPEGWKMDSINELCDIVDYRGKTPQKVERGTFLVTAKNIRNGKIDYNISKEYVKTEEYEDVMSRGIPEVGDVLITTEAPLGEVASVDNDSIALAQRIIKLRGKKDRLENKYLKYYMLSRKFQKEIKKDATGSTVEGIKGTRLRKKMIKFPKSIKEQLVIADILDKLDKNIEKTTETIEKYKKVKKGLMDDLLTGKIRIKDGKWVEETKFKYVDGIGEVPKEWSVDILDKLTKERIKDGTHSTPKYLERGIPFLRVTDIQNKEINLENTKYISIKEHKELIKRVKPEKEDILYSKNGTIGIVKIVDWNWEFSIFVSLALIKPNKKINTEFLAIVLNSFITSKQIKFRAKQGTVTNLHLEEIREFLIPYPSIDEQQGICNILSKQDQLIEQEEQYLQKLQKLKNGLMKDLLTGRKRVNID